jgi:hypothetical protein
VDQLGLARQKFRSFRESILRIIWPLPGLLTILQTFEEVTKNRTLDWLSTGFTVNSTVADIFNIGMKYSTEMNPTPLTVFDEQHIE